MEVINFSRHRCFTPHLEYLLQMFSEIQLSVAGVRFLEGDHQTRWLVYHVYFTEEAFMACGYVYKLLILFVYEVQFCLICVFEVQL